MPEAVRLSKANARRALVRHHFALSPTPDEVFRRLRSIQIDPINPVGCSHDLVLHAHTPGYKIGDWEALAYQERKIYDGWDKQASLVPFEGWPLRRIFHKVHRQGLEQKILHDLRDETELVLGEIRERGPLMPRELSFQRKTETQKGSWQSASVTKQILRALWHSGIIMTAGRNRGQHVYDLAERIVPTNLFNEPILPDSEARRLLVLERHKAMGIVRPNATAEVWSYGTLGYTKKESIAELLVEEAIVPVEIEGIKANTTSEFLSLLDSAPLEPRVVFIAPLDPFLWDRKMTALTFDFDYSWEIYIPEAKRRWGYYVLPILFGDRLVARVEFWHREGMIEVRQWHWENAELEPEFWSALEKATKELMVYASASGFTVRDHIDSKVRDFFLSVSQ